MRTLTCLYPQHIVNPYTHERLTVACNKCEACQNAHAKKWIDKLEQERRCWKYCYMVTLTYDDAHLPCFYADGMCLKDSKYDVRIPFEELDFRSPRDTKYFNSRINHRLGIPHASIDDIQLFHKRLNKHIHDKFTQKYQNFRYFLVSELGSDTHRPHYHGLYFFNSRQVARNIKEIFFACWKNSDSFENGVKADSVRGSAASYVAQYMRAFSDLPSFYKHPKLRPFYVFSKQPPIGSLQCNDEETRKLFFAASPVRTQYEVKSNKFINVRLSNSFENRLFPRLPKDRDLPFNVRVKLYGLAGELNCWSFESFCYALKEKYKSPFSPKYLEFTELGRYERDFIFWLTNGFRMSPADYINRLDYEQVQNRVKRFYYICNRVCSQADVFGISVQNYVQVIDKYYSNLELFKTNAFYAAQENYSQSLHDLEDLSFMYDNPEGFLLYNHLEYVPQLEDTFAYKDLKSTSRKIYNDSTKKHKSNEYLDKCRDKKLSLILKDYFANV